MVTMWTTCFAHKDTWVFRFRLNRLIAPSIRKEPIIMMFFLLSAGLLIIIFAVIAAVAASVVSAVAADQDIEDWIAFLYKRAKESLQISGDLEATKFIGHFLYPLLLCNSCS